MARKKRVKKQQPEPPKAGPGPGGISPRTALGVGFAVLGGLALFSALRGSKDSEPEAKPAEVKASEAKKGPGSNTHDSPPSDDAGAPKLKRAMALWAAFDQLPASEKNKSKLTDTLDTAAQIIKAEPRASSDRKSLELQGVEFRKRAAPMAQAGARATGDNFTTLVPADDRARCLELGQAWSADGANMAMLGFRRIECAGNPPKVWELKP
jgi:hypothetical protein